MKSFLKFVTALNVPVHLAIIKCVIFRGESGVTSELVGSIFPHHDHVSDQHILSQFLA
jgi:hypothetical protein